MTVSPYNNSHVSLKINPTKPIRNSGYSQGMVLTALLLVFLLMISGCQTQHNGMKPSASASSDAAVNNDQDNGNTATSDASNTQTSSDLTFADGLGYEIKWPLEERFIISPPEHVRALMMKTCKDTGYITPYINRIQFEENGVKAYFLCRGFGG
jgi:hypothetical protein